MSPWPGAHPAVARLGRRLTTPTAAFGPTDGKDEHERGNVKQGSAADQRRQHGQENQAGRDKSRCCAFPNHRDQATGSSNPNGPAVQYVQSHIPENYDEEKGGVDADRQPTTNPRATGHALKGNCHNGGVKPSNVRIALDAGT